ncbi:MAG: hypothetical protein OEW67_15325 [Cyclobacteriaceae bacterium]|nr:hypothetical protein [Cyclobacteriaceae bacterium]
MNSFFKVTFLLAFFSLNNLIAQISDFSSYDFSKADSVSALYPKHSISNLSELSHKLTTPLQTDVEKFRAIYKWVCDNIENDYSYYAKNKRMREKLNNQPEKLVEWNKEFLPKVFTKLVKEHKTVCTGYAYLIRELSYYANIECEIVNGYGRTAQANIGGEGIPNHSWNTVKLNNRWYLCDATWSSGSITSEQSIFIKEFSEAYFLVNPVLFVQNHYPLDTKWFLMDQPPTLPEFLNSPLIYKNSLGYNIIPETPSVFKPTIKKGEKLTFRFKSINELDNLELEVGYAGKMNSFYPEIYQDKEGFYCIDHVFKSKGIYDVHLILEDKYLFTYAVISTK